MSPSPPLYFDAVLHPHRSLGPRGFLILMALLCAVSFTTGMIFVSKGAWPVFGFLGLDVLLVYIAFRSNYRSARMFETIRLSDQALEVARVDARGERQTWRFHPFWVRLDVAEGGPDDGRLYITSHGSGVYVGDFLTPPERLDLAAALRRALFLQRENPSTSNML